MHIADIQRLECELVNEGKNPLDGNGSFLLLTTFVDISLMGSLKPPAAEPIAELIFFIERSSKRTSFHAEQINRHQFITQFGNFIEKYFEEIIVSPCWSRLIVNKLFKNESVINGLNTSILWKLCSEYPSGEMWKVLSHIYTRNRLHATLEWTIYMIRTSVRTWMMLEDIWNVAVLGLPGSLHLWSLARRDSIRSSSHMVGN